MVGYITASKCTKVMSHVTAVPGRVKGGGPAQITMTTVWQRLHNQSNFSLSHRGLETMLSKRGVVLFLLWNCSQEVGCVQVGFPAFPLYWCIFNSNAAFSSVPTCGHNKSSLVMTFLDQHIAAWHAYWPTPVSDSLMISIVLICVNSCIQLRTLKCF